VGGVTVEGSGRAARSGLPRERTVRSRLGDNGPARVPTTEPDVAATLSARVGRRPELAQQAKLLERSLELGALLAPLDPLERAESGIDGGALSLAREVRPQARLQVTGASDIEHLIQTVAEEVHAGPSRRLRDERPLDVERPCPRRRKLDDVRDGAGAAFL